jgi:PAS domain-containing protein
VNGALCRTLGYPADELLTKSFQDVTYPDDLAADLVQVELMREGKIDKDGAIIWARNTVSCVPRELLASNRSARRRSERR